MGLDIYFNRNVRRVLDSLRQANERALCLAQRYGLNVEVAGLYKEIYDGALDDVAAAFGVMESIVLGQIVESAFVARKRQPQPWDGRGPLSM